MSPISEDAWRGMAGFGVPKYGVPMQKKEQVLSPVNQDRTAKLEMMVLTLAARLEEYTEVSGLLEAIYQARSLAAGPRAEEYSTQEKEPDYRRLLANLVYCLNGTRRTSEICSVLNSEAGRVARQALGLPE
jgi:hypothetical protein